MNIKQAIALFSLTVSSALLPVTAEVLSGTTLSVNFESANIVGSGRHLNMQRVPVVDINTDITTLYDASFKFTFLPDQELLFEQITSAAVSPPTAVANITPGIYQAQLGSFCYILEGPTALSGNRSLYTFRGTNGITGCNNAKDGFSAQIVSGPAAGHPDINNRDIVPNLVDNYVYGFLAGGGSFSLGNSLNNNWEQNELIGIRQSGDQLILGLFSEGVDSNNLPNDFVDPRETTILTKINP